ncbi:MAG: response regulator transcription factor [Aeromicrobium sp.]
MLEVLIVEDEVRLARALADGLEANGLSATVCHDGETGYRLATENKYDVVVLDLMLPGLSGNEVCTRLRAAGIRTPILVLTASEGQSIEVDVLNLGADDYLRKPFSYSVLVARCHALSRRAESAVAAELVWGDLVLDTNRRTVRRGDTPIELTQREFALLEYLIRGQGNPRSKQEILDHVWGAGFDRGENVVEVYVGYLRRKIDVPFGRSTVRTVRGHGYALDDTG